eukprot:scaffold2490_cov169-Amphora_coffeaeformis.AAC.9
MAFGNGRQKSTKYHAISFGSASLLFVVPLCRQRYDVRASCGVVCSSSNQHWAWRCVGHGHRSSTKSSSRSGEHLTMNDVLG